MTDLWESLFGDGDDDLFVNAVSSAEGAGGKRLSKPETAARSEDIGQKRRRIIEDAGPISNTTWAMRIRSFFEDIKVARGAQSRQLILESVCTGMATHHMAMKDRPAQRKGPHTGESFQEKPSVFF